MLRHKRFWLLAAVLVMALVVAACGPADEGDTEVDEDGTPGEVEVEETADKELTIGYVTWAEDIAVTHLWQVLLEERGYEVESIEMQAGPLFAGLSQGSIDFFMDSWLPITHSDYWDEYGDQLEKLGVWYDTADLGLAVPEYVEIESISELADNADLFDSEIIGIDAGAGLMGITQEDAMPGYGLDDWTLVEGSETTMLAALEKAVDNEEPIVVTLWRPHWAFAEYPIRYLEDPESLMNAEGAEQIYTLATEGFSEKHPDVARWLGNFELDDEALGTLEVEFNKTDDFIEAAESWLADADNRALADSWFD